MATRKRAKNKQSSNSRASSKTSRKKSTNKKSTQKKSPRKAARRTLIAPKGDKRYVRRSKRGRFKESDDVGQSLSSDRRTRAKRKAPRGQGDKGD